MGYIRHNAIIVTTGYADKELAAAHTYAVELGCSVSPISESVTNGVQSFAVFPDGSKERWQESTEGDERREALIRHLRATAYDDGSSPLDWVEVQYGDDNGQTLVIRDSDEGYRQRDAAPVARGV